LSASAKIRLHRKSNIAASIRKLEILVDGQKIGNIANGKEQSFEVTPGRHRIQVKLLSDSEPLDVELSPNSTLELECGISPQFWKRNLAGAAGILVLMYIAKHGLHGGGFAILFLCGIVLAANFRAGGTYYLKRGGTAQSER